MVINNAPLNWRSLSHHGRYKRLQKVRRVYCRNYSARQEDLSGRTVHLDGAWINDVPSFHLSMGEAVNGLHGYFGGCLDSLADCLCGGFGVKHPLTIRLTHSSKVRDALDGRAWCRFRAESFQEAIDGGSDIAELMDWGYFDDDSEAEVQRRTAIYKAALANEAFDCEEFHSYFDVILEVFAHGGIKLVLENEEPEDES
ncbi:MAG: barstar family protein [Capsulimonas sp.]|uniref:barstar family protein n=1 Tax=Capsulimonas sp. TaxID=2494211 RepID=UPI003267A1E4